MLSGAGQVEKAAAKLGDGEGPPRRGMLQE